MGLRNCARLVLAAFVLSLPASTRAEINIRPCPAKFHHLLSEKLFRQHAVRSSSMRPVPPIVKDGTARLYRTSIRDQAALGPNFAGHYTVILIGCGAGTICVAIADAQTGKVHFPRGLGNVSWSFVDTGKQDIQRLTFRRSSRLLVAFGYVNEDEKTEGLSYFIWEGGELKRVRFIPMSRVCRPS